MKKRFFALLLAAALFLCASCTPAAEVTPSPTPTPIPTPTPTPTPEPTPTTSFTPTAFWGGGWFLTPHYWSDSGFCYTSEALGIKLRFPPHWESYFTFEERTGEYTLRDEASNEWVTVEDTKLYLVAKDLKFYGEDMVFATIYPVPKGLTFDADSGAWLTMAETEEKSYVCAMYTMYQVELSPLAGGRGITPEFAVCESVQGGIMDGRWEIEVLDPKS